ncbi:MAG: DNA replication/repair protein RecF [Pseudomonadota bacterium]|nr:DNA replication/repair protein RecF [Pseudomonadota bacterium]
MLFSSLQCSGFRNLKKLNLDFNHQFVIFHGENGSGKTSLLEALYFLSHAKSFRASSLKKLICHDSESFSLFSYLVDGTRSIPLGIERDLSGKQKIRFDSESIPSIGAVAQSLPVQFLDTDAHRLLAGSPSNRRSFLDWGVFHVEHCFSDDWRSYQKVLKQRNHLLKLGCGDEYVEPWTRQLIEYGEKITAARSNYVFIFGETFSSLWKELMPLFPVPELGFFKGWRDCSLEEALFSSMGQDRRYGYTTCGPHRFDLKIELDGRSVFDFFSQGQQKSLIYALKVAQGLFLKNSSKKDVVYLIDDLPAELDETRLGLVVEVLRSHAAQVFITSIDNKFDFRGLEFDSVLYPISGGSVIV